MWWAWHYVAACRLVELSPCSDVKPDWSDNMLGAVMTLMTDVTQCGMVVRLLKKIPSLDI